MASRPRFRFQYSLRTLFALTAVAALLLVPVAWVTRERQRVLAAREAALRAVVLAERDRALANHARQDENAANTRPAAVEQLIRENAELKKSVEKLQREIERLKAIKAP
jgi:hypothetical protein